MQRRTARIAQRYISMQEAAHYLGLGERAIRVLISEGKLAAYRPTGTPTGDIRIDLGELEQYVRSTQVPAAG